MLDKDKANSLTLDDLVVGQVFSSEFHTLNSEEMKAFAQKYDPQPFHTDDEAAKKSFFGQLVASGWYTASITMRLLVRSMPIKGGLVGAGGEVTWLRPAKANDTISVETEVKDIRPSKSHPDRGIVIIRSTTYNQNKEPIQVLTSKLVVPRASA